MAHIERRLRGSKLTYRARYRDPAGREHSKTFTRRVDAERFVVEVEHAKSRGTWVDPTLGRITFGAWLDQWWATTTNLRESTQARDKASLRVHAIPRFGRMPLAAIRQIQVRAWVAELAGQGLKPATVVKAYQLFGKVMAAAVDAGIIAQSPCRRIPLPKVEQDEKRFLTPTEIARLASVIQPRFRVLVLVSAYGGLRIGELAGLRRGRVDTTHTTVTVLEIATDVSGRLVFGPPKTRAARRTVSLPAPVADELEQHLASYAEPDQAALVFTATRGSALRATNFRRRVWTSAARAAELDGLRIHDLRHTAVALWIAAGASPKEVARRAGHTSVKTVLDVYGHLYDEADVALRERLEAMFVPVVASPTDSCGPNEAEVRPMLADCPIHAALPAMDLQRARRFYTETLGLTPDSEGPDGLFFRCGGGTRFLVYPSGGTASGAHTQMTWNTPDIEATVAELKARGVVFEEYDTPEVKTVNGVATLGESKGAWFKDTEGNMLALGQFD